MVYDFFLWLIKKKRKVLFYSPQAAHTAGSASLCSWSKSIYPFLQNLFQQSSPTLFVTLKNDPCNSELISPHFQPLKSPIHYQNDGRRAAEWLSAQGDGPEKSQVKCFSSQYVHQSVLEQELKSFPAQFNVYSAMHSCWQHFFDFVHCVIC